MKSNSTSMPTPDAEHRVFRAVPRPSDRSMHEVTTPDLDMATPSSTRGMGTYRLSLASCASRPFSIAMNAAAGPPRGPVTATTSPGLAPDLSIGGLPSIVPRAVPATIPGPGFVSPPTMPVPQNSQHWSIPLMMSYADWESRSGGRASAARNPTGLAPMAARSLKLTAAAYHPNCS